MRILAAPDAHDELPRSARRATDTGGSDDVAGGYDQRPEAVADNGIKHHHLDHVGTPRLVTDRCGATRSTHDYYPFGEQIGTSADRERMKFTGHERDHPYPPSTLGDLDYMHARTYTPYLGRFLSVDPGRDNDAKVPQSWNLYAYVRGNSINATDPDGREVHFTSAMIKGLRENEAFRAAFRVWRATKTGGSQWARMVGDADTRYVMDVGRVFHPKGTSREVLGLTAPSDARQMFVKSGVKLNLVEVVITVNVEAHREMFARDGAERCQAQRS